MTVRPRTLGELAEARKAEALAAKMRMRQFETWAEQAETAPDLLTKSYFATKYRELFGIEPSQRHTFQEALAAIGGGAKRTVEELLLHYQHQSNVGPSSLGSAAEPPFVS